MMALVALDHDAGTAPQKPLVSFTCGHSWHPLLNALPPNPVPPHDASQPRSDNDEPVGVVVWITVVSPPLHYPRRQERTTNSGREEGFAALLYPLVPRFDHPFHRTGQLSRLLRGCIGH
jgi:hypothetical protein